MQYENGVTVSGEKFALFAHSETGMGEGVEQLTHWATLDDVINSKDSWFEKERQTFILARVDNVQLK
jgi:hypothetical protein